MSDDELLEYAHWLLTQKISGATRDFLEDLLHFGFTEPECNARQQRRVMELMLLYPR